MSQPPTPEQQADFRAHRPLPGVNFAYDELVTITEGEHTGNVGSVIAVESLGDDPVYLVEIDSGFEVPVAQSCLQGEEG
jgi:hypothetical protein